MKYEKLNMKDTKNEKPKLEKLPFDEKSMFFTPETRGICAKIFGR